ncbi:lipoprotein-releasing ABC transporter permease subunit [bacterium]|nr:lipoprotein-releasing ABC transporter permease subunit [bacterium]
MRYEFFIGLRYLSSKQRERFISLITLITTCGIAVGVMALIVTLAVMNGFGNDLRDKILGMTAHLIVIDRAGPGFEDYEAAAERLRTFKPEIEGISPYLQTQAILSSPFQVKGVVLTGIEPDLEKKVTNVVRFVQEGSSNFSKEELEIILGEELAKNLGVRIGDKVSLILPKMEKKLSWLSPLGMLAVARSFKVIGLFNSGMYEYDASFAYISLSSAKKLLGTEGVTGIAIKTEDPFKVSKIAREIAEAFPDYGVITWQDKNRNLLSALKLEKAVTAILLSLIIFVSVFNIANTLIMTVLAKTKEIGILRSMGAKKPEIMTIFIFKGILSGLFGTLIGLVGGIALSKLISYYQFVKLPSDIYYLSYIPVSINYNEVALVCLTALFLSFLSTLYPAWSAANLNPVEALRYE